MKTNFQFQARDIQNILGIPKHRYEYIASKIGIEPDVEEVEGRGHTHIYSFKNLLQFAIVNQANKLGLNPKSSRKLIIFLNEFEKSKKLGVFDPDENTFLKLHYIDWGGVGFFAISAAFHP